MKHKIFRRLSKIAASLCISAGVLAAANIETIWQEYQHQDMQENFMSQARLPHHKFKSAILGTGYKPLQSSLSLSLEQDELKDTNPFAHLSSQDPLQQMIQKGVVNFRRETYRSPDYQEESGYDLLSYEIEHTDGSKSTIMAYLEQPESGLRDLDKPDKRQIFVVFMVSEGDRTLYSFFRDGDLIDQSELATSVAQAMVNRRLSEGVPFLSVSR